MLAPTEPITAQEPSDSVFRNILKPLSLLARSDHVKLTSLSELASAVIEVGGNGGASGVVAIASLVGFDSPAELKAVTRKV